MCGRLKGIRMCVPHVQYLATVCVCVAVLQWQISECEAQIQELTEELNTWSYFKVSPIVSYPTYVANSN